jgi:hypothetical protein
MSSTASPETPTASAERASAESLLAQFGGPRTTAEEHETDVLTFNHVSLGSRPAYVIADIYAPERESMPKRVPPPPVRRRRGEKKRPSEKLPRRGHVGARRRPATRRSTSRSTSRGDPDLDPSSSATARPGGGGVRRCACGCLRSLDGRRATAVYFDVACRVRAHRARRATRRSNPAYVTVAEAPRRLREAA